MAAILEQKAWTAEHEAKVRELNECLAQVSQEALGKRLQLNLNNQAVENDIRRVIRRVVFGWQTPEALATNLIRAYEDGRLSPEYFIQI